MCGVVRRAARLGVALGLSWAPGLAAQQLATDTSPFKTQKEKISYALGLDLGGQLRRASVDGRHSQTAFQVARCS